MEKLTIGADPEFTAIYKDCEYSATRFLVDAKRRKQCGYDGHSSTVELRPKPQTDPRLLTKEIGRILRLNKMAFLGMRLVVDQQEAPVGGHIHFGHKKLINNQILGNKLTANLVYTLLPLVRRLETPEAYEARRRYGYGKDYDWRPQKHGLEYRALPSFIVNPLVTDAIFCTAYAIAYDSIILDKEFLVTPINKIPSLIRGLSTYDKFKDQIETLFNLIENNNKISDLEIKTGWGITYRKLRDKNNQNIKDIFQKNIFIYPKKQPTAHITFNSKDFEIPQIATRVNHILTKINPKAKPANDFYIYGLKDGTRCIVRSDRRILKKTYLYEDLDSNINLYIRPSDKKTLIGIPRYIRLDCNFFPEMLVFKLFLLTHPLFYSRDDLDKNGAVELPFQPNVEQLFTKLANNKRYLRAFLEEYLKMKMVAEKYRLNSSSNDDNNQHHQSQDRWVYWTGDITNISPNVSPSVSSNMPQYSQALENLLNED